jgi:sugar/nucleoside kinase (ribokinase family)
LRDFDVLALGELNVDLIMTGMNTLPVPGREIIAKTCSLTMGSSTAICTAGLARLGLKTSFLGIIGDDGYGRLAREQLASYGVNVENLIVDKTIQTGITVSLTSGCSKDRAMVTYLGSICALTPAHFDREKLARAKHVHVGSFFLQSGLRPALSELFEFARSRGVTTSLDAGWDDSGCWDYGISKVLAHTDVFLPNELEAKAITGLDSAEKAAAELAKLCRICAVKCGPDGAVVAANGGVKSYKTYDAPVRDTTGAGDSFNAGFLYGFINEFDTDLSAAYGNACGSISVTRYGGASACASLDEVKDVLKLGYVKENAAKQ